jgi:hypothetical protein
MDSAKRVLIESTLELSVFGEKIRDALEDDSKETWTSDSPIQREVVERILGFYQYWDETCWALPLEEFIPWGSDQKLDKWYENWRKWKINSDLMMQGLMLDTRRRVRVVESQGRLSDTQAER